MAELASTLNRPVDPFNVIGQIARKPSVTERGAEARRQLEPTMRAESQATSEAMRAEAAAGRELARQAAGVEEQAVRGMEAAGTSLAQTMAQYPQRQVQDFDPDAGVELAGMTALLGAFAGAISGQAALTSMKGITEGYRTGRQDLYEREVAKYQADVQKFKDKVANAKTIYDNAIKLESQRRGAGMAKLKELEPVLQDSVITAKIRANDFVGAGEVIKNAMKLSDELSSKLIQATSKAQSAAAKEAVETARTSGPAPYVAELNVPPSGVPTPPINPMAKAGSNKSYDARLATNLKAAESVLDRARKENDKNVEKSRQADLAEAALKRLVLKKFNEGKKKGQIPANATLNLDDLSVNGANLPQVTGGVFGLPFIGDFFTKIKTTTDPDAADFQKEAANFQREAYVPGEGQISNFERELFRQASFDLGRPVLTNLAILQGTREAAKRQMQRMQFLEDYYAQNDTIVGAERLWQIYSENNRFLSIDPYGKVTFNPGTTDWKTWFRSKQGQPIDTLMPQQQVSAQPTQSPPVITNQEEYDALPPGSFYIDSETNQRARKP